MLKKIGVSNIALAVGLIVFSAIVFRLTTGWFTIVMSVFATIVFLLIVMSPDEKEDSK